MTSPELAISASAAEEVIRLKTENARLQAIANKLRDERGIARAALRGAMRANPTTHSSTTDHTEEPGSDSDSEGPTLKKGKKGD
jgi:hypothetical protein